MIEVEVVVSCVHADAQVESEGIVHTEGEQHGHTDKSKPRRGDDTGKGLTFLKQISAPQEE